MSAPICIFSNVKCSNPFAIENLIRHFTGSLFSIWEQLMFLTLAQAGSNQLSTGSTFVQWWKFSTLGFCQRWIQDSPWGGEEGVNIPFCEMYPSKKTARNQETFGFWSTKTLQGLPLDPPMSDLQHRFHNIMHKWVKPYVAPFAKDVMLRWRSASCKTEKQVNALGTKHFTPNSTLYM